MSRHIGEVYEGVISGITGYGLYVELPNTVEGMIHVTSFVMIITIMMTSIMRWLDRTAEMYISLARRW